MARRNPRGAVAGGSRPRPTDKPSAIPDGTPLDDPDEELAVWTGERLRRIALGLTAALIVSRAFWPGETDYRVDAGTGLPWVLALFVTAGLALASALVGGRFRWRFAWADLGVVSLAGLVAAAASHAVDRRVALNLGWEWVSYSIAYLLIRNLPRTRGESSALTAAIAATAVAVSAYALFHVGIELEPVRQKYLANRSEALRILGIPEGSPAQALYENRLLYSNEATGTFALANSLAGFLVGPLVVMIGLAWETLTRREGRGPRLAALAMASAPIGLVVYCLILTKSRSAWIGLVVGLAVVAWRERTRLRPRTLALTALGGSVVVAGLAAAAYARGGLDTLVLTQSGKSLRYRLEYWQGAWGAINQSSSTFWSGRGPGNFADPYLKFKLPESSEEIKDPHNFVLEVWSAGGLTAVVALGVAITMGLWSVLGPSGRRGGAEGSTSDASPSPAAKDRQRRRDPDAPPSGLGWLIGFGFLGWVLALPPIGAMKPFEGEFDRWLILGAAWLVALGCGQLLWRRRPLDPTLLGAGFLAILVNLLAAGGISVPAVALTLWGLLAVGMNLREDRPSGRLREAGGRLGAFGVACVWVAVLGLFVGTALPYWKAQAALAAARDELAITGRSPDFDRAEALLSQAADADPFSPQPWSQMAGLDYQLWLSRGGKVDDLRWRKIPIEMYKAVSPPRNPANWSRHRERAMMTSLLLKQLSSTLDPKDLTRFRADVVESSRTAVRLYPTNPSLRAWLAEASDAIGMIPDALKEGREAIRLDDILNQANHQDRRLDPAVRTWLDGKIPQWEKSVESSPTFPALDSGTTPR